MSKTKFAFLYKYIFLLAILALLFSASFSFARYATQASNDTSADIDEFNIEVHLYDHDKVEITTETLPEVTTDDFSTYSDTYYLEITNYDRYELYYQIKETTGNFIFTTTYESVKLEEDSTFTQDARTSVYGDTFASSVVDVNGGSSSGYNQVTITLNIAASDDAIANNKVSSDEITLPISFYLEYQHTEAYEVTYKGEAHDTSSWTALNGSGGSTLASGNYYLDSDLTLTSGITFSGNSTLCLNGYTISGSNSSSTSLNLVSIASGSILTIEDCA